MSAIPLRIIPGRTRALTEDLQVRRVLPHHQQRMVGPFIFLDEMGPADFAPGTGMDVLPHPHIGLATVTYLFEGAITHRDNLGVVQEIRPGDLNW
ncbi:MAG: pirin family protein, partial [Leptospiraceae bacterium]|nr:pirin family protein [Leptospiraceae bacterium]